MLVGTIGVLASCGGGGDDVVKGYAAFGNAENQPREKSLVRAVDIVFFYGGVNEDRRVSLALVSAEAHKDIKGGAADGVGHSISFGKRFAFLMNSEK